MNARRWAALVALYVMGWTIVYGYLRASGFAAELEGHMVEPAEACWWVSLVWPLWLVFRVGGTIGRAIDEIAAEAREAGL